MISDVGAKIIGFFKNVGHALLGIMSELLLAALLILIGFCVCIFWWGILR